MRAKVTVSLKTRYTDIVSIPVRKYVYVYVCEECVYNEGTYDPPSP